MQYIHSNYIKNKKVYKVNNFNYSTHATATLPKSFPPQRELL